MNIMVKVGCIDGKINLHVVILENKYSCNLRTLLQYYLQIIPQYMLLLVLV